MDLREVHEIFKSYFPDYAGDNEAIWYSNGRNSIRVRLKDHREITFTYEGPDVWCLETVKSHVMANKR